VSRPSDGTCRRPHGRPGPRRRPRRARRPRHARRATSGPAHVGGRRLHPTGPPRRDRADPPRPPNRPVRTAADDPCARPHPPNRPVRTPADDPCARPWPPPARSGPCPQDGRRAPRVRSFERGEDDDEGQPVMLVDPRRGKIVRRRPTLPHSLPCSTIGAERLSFRVRNGTGRFPFAMAAVTLSSCTDSPCTQPSGLVGAADRYSGTAQWTRQAFAGTAPKGGV
jgi:hypothetical protein